MSIVISTEAFAPYDELANFEQAHQLSGSGTGSVGAAATFIGTMRDFNEKTKVTRMTLEHYPGMTEKQLELIVSRAHEQWDIQEALIIHRVGDILPGEPIVLCAIWSAHRAAAFDACRFLMESLKSEATFWKQETLSDNTTRWVEKNTPGFSS